MENKKMDWSRPLLVELEKATYSVGQTTCDTGPSFGIPCSFGNGNNNTCSLGNLAGSLCYKGLNAGPK